MCITLLVYRCSSPNILDECVSSCTGQRSSKHGGRRSEKRRADQGSQLDRQGSHVGGNSVKVNVTGCVLCLSAVYATFEISGY